MNETIYKFLWNLAPGLMALAVVVCCFVFFAHTFNKVVVKVETLDVRVIALEKDVDDLKVNIDKRFDQVDKRMDRLEDKIDNLITVLLDEKKKP